MHHNNLINWLVYLVIRPVYKYDIFNIRLNPFVQGCYWSEMHVYHYNILRVSGEKREIVCIKLFRENRYAGVEQQ